MLRSMFASVSGLRAHQTMMDVTGNNIANVNTQGFKSSRTTFAETLVQTVRSGGLATAARGATNPMQIGLGSLVANIDQIMTQGAALVTNRSTDIMLEGDGFFQIIEGDRVRYTRAGAFNYDPTGTLATGNGARVMGWVADVNGVIDTNAPLTVLQVGNASVPPAPTTFATTSGNLAASSLIGDQFATTSLLFDSQGTAFNMTSRYTKTGPNAWNLDITYVDEAGVTQNLSLGNAVTFDGAGELIGPASVTIGPVTLGNGLAQTFDVNLGSAQNPLTQYDSAGVLNVPERDGTSAAELETVYFTKPGIITGRYSNGSTATLGQIAVITFQNPEGLSKVGETMWEQSQASGEPIVGVPGVGRSGMVLAGALEGSNVDLAQEFTNLVLAQRGFEANSRVVTVSDEMLGALVNMKR